MDCVNSSFAGAIMSSLMVLFMLKCIAFPVALVGVSSEELGNTPGLVSAFFEF